MDVEIWDVFADRPLAGNALAVVHVGEDTELTDRAPDATAPDATAPDATAPDATAPDLADVRVEVGGRAFLVLEGRLKASLEDAP